jgi:hypothetical protein
MQRLLHHIAIRDASRETCVRLFIQGVLAFYLRTRGATENSGKGGYFLSFSMPTVVDFLIAPSTWCCAVIDGGREEPNVESLGLMSCLHWSDLDKLLRSVTISRYAQEAKWTRPILSTTDAGGPLSSVPQRLHAIMAGCNELQRDEIMSHLVEISGRAL